jgi:asparagine synthetase B (glutamine-hydrolysing)
MMRFPYLAKQKSSSKHRGEDQFGFARSHREKRLHQRFRIGWNFEPVRQPLTNAVALN